MFKHLSMLFDHQELPSLVNRYDDVRVNGDPGEAAALRENEFPQERKCFEVLYELLFQITLALMFEIYMSVLIKYSHLCVKSTEN